MRELCQRLRRVERQQRGRSAEPSAGIIDAHPVDGADTVAADSRGYDGAKLRDGRKRHVLTDPPGLLLEVTVTPADMYDSVAAPDLLEKFTDVPGRLSDVRCSAARPGCR
ncbi:transposase [Streptomyces sp. CB01881]|uniref:transposase n=1 Tax=Streptomyces sp. CB01881 TaxID=2078691 RepID=UPI0013872D6D|nr:transposase [Streptomyces sp. CB01881]